MTLRFSQDFQKDLDAMNFFDEPFAFVRFGDGERSIVDGISCIANEGWESDNTPIKFREQLRSSLEFNEEGYYLGLGCPCCDPTSWLSLMTTSNAPIERITNANVFVNGNHQNFRKRVYNEELLIRGFWVVGESADPLPEWGDDYATVPDRVPDIKWCPVELVSKLLEVDRPIFLCAGPAAPVIAHTYWMRQPPSQRQSIIDVGSAIDDLLYGKSTRTYFRPRHPLNVRVCKWFPPFKVKEYRLLGNNETYDAKWNEWSRIYEYPYVCNRLSSSKAISVHNVACGHDPLHARFAQELRDNGFRVTNSDLYPTNGSFKDYNVYNVNHEWNGEKFDAAILVSGLHLIKGDPTRIISNLLSQVKTGGSVIMTFDIPGVQLEQLNKLLGRQINICMGNPLLGSNSRHPSQRYRDLSIGVAVLERTESLTHVNTQQRNTRPAHNEITAIVASHNQPKRLEKQISAIRRQTVPPKDIFVWKTNADSKPHAPILNGCGIASANQDRGGLAKFSFALTATTKYVCVFDDGIIPGARWFENCIQTIATHRGVLGSRGMKFNFDDPSLNIEFINNEPCDVPMEVDTLNGCWFFEREWLSEFWRELPHECNQTGIESIHFSYMIQKHLNLKTFIPPKPQGQFSWWGFRPKVLPDSSVDSQSAFSKDSHQDLRKVVQTAIANGFQLVAGVETDAIGEQ